MMAGKKKMAAPVAEQPDMSQAPQGAQEQAPDIRVGVGLDDTAVSDISTEIVVVCAERGLNLRTGPGCSFPVVEVLEDGTLLAVLELPHGAEVPGWALVHTGQRTGWVDRGFLRPLERAEV